MPEYNENFAPTLLQTAADSLKEEKFEYAASCANKVIEHDLNNYQAWALRAAAAAGGATVADSRMEEAVNAWMTALHFVPPEDEALLQTQVIDGFTQLLQNEISKRTNAFAKTPNEENKQRVLAALSEGLRLQNLLTVQAKLSFDRGEPYAKIARMLCDAAVAGFAAAAKAFGPNPGNMQQWQWEKHTDEGDNCMILLEKAVHYCKDSDLGKNICDHYIRIGETVKETCSWKYDETDSSADSFVRDQTFTAAAKRIREDDIRRFRTIRGYYEANQISRLCRELAAARKDEDEVRAIHHYWNTHMNEKNALELERDHLQATIRQTEYDMHHLPISAALEQTRNNIAQKEAEINDLGFGKRKKKNALKEQIRELRTIEANQHAEETQTINAMLWTQKKSRARIAEIKRIFAAKRGLLPAPPRTYYLEKTEKDLSPQALFDHLKTILPDPYHAVKLHAAKKFAVPFSPAFAGLGSIWAIQIEKNSADTAKSVFDPQLFIAAKNKNEGISAIVVQCSAAHTADEEALRDYGRIVACLLLALLPSPDQPEAEWIALQLRHGKDHTLICKDDLRMEFLFTEEEQTDGSVRCLEHILIRPVLITTPHPPEQNDDDSTADI